MTTPFPHDVTGSILLTFASNAVNPADDPAIQFASSSRTATFTIPANETQARFGSDSHRGPMAFQSGTVAGTPHVFGRSSQWERFRPASPVPAQMRLRFRFRPCRSSGSRRALRAVFPYRCCCCPTAREVTQVSLAFNTSPQDSAPVAERTAGCLASGNVLTLDVAPLFNEWFNRDATFGGWPCSAPLQY